jgi:hypothetical protein
MALIFLQGIMPFLIVITKPIKHHMIGVKPFDSEFAEVMFAA